MKTKEKIIKVTSLKGFDQLCLKTMKTAIYRELTARISMLGKEYSYILVMLGPRDGLRGYITEYPKRKGAYIRIAEYTMKKSNYYRAKPVANGYSA